MKPFSAQTHYEVLEISVSATAREIRQAYERLTQLYAEEQVALYGLIDAGRADALRRRLKEALDVLEDDSRRERYDVSLGLPPREGPAVAAKPAAPVKASPKPSAPQASFGYGEIAWVTPANQAPAPQSTHQSYSVPAPVQSAPRAAPPPIVEAPAPPSKPLLLTQVLQVAPVETPTVADSAPSPDAVPIATLSAEAVTAETPLPEDVQSPVTMSDESVEVAIIPGRSTSREFRLERPKPHEVPEGVEINGDLLRQVRMARGLSLVQLAERTRIGTKHLENVEGDRYDALPAPVYLRGMLMSLARELGLDAVRVAHSYMAFVEARRNKP